MKILGIKNIVRKDVPLYYRRPFSGVALIEIPQKKLEEDINFLIETTAQGDKRVSVRFVNPLDDYPLVPLMRELKGYIYQLDEDGKLPA